jgi:hypothetical protein
MARPKKPRKRINGVAHVETVCECKKWIPETDNRWYICRDCRLKYMKGYHQKRKMWE